MIYNQHQRNIGNKIEANLTRSNWSDWKWQTKHRIRTLPVLEKLLGIKLSDEARSKFNATTEKFPFSITPYYLS